MLFLKRKTHKNTLKTKITAAGPAINTTDKHTFLQEAFSMKSEYEIKKEICDIGRRIYDRGMVAANDGNISVKLNDNEFLCTPTGVSKGFMTPDFICKVDKEGKVIQANPGFKPSSEIKMHMRVYKERPDVNAVVHAHPMYATSFAIAGIPLTQPIMPEAVIALGCVPIAKYGRPSTEEIPDAVSEHVQYFDAVLLENHGALTYANTLLNAYYKMESTEFYAQLLYQSKMLGGPKEFTPQQVEDLYEIRRKFGMPGRHPANLCPNTLEGKPSCHNCGGGCSGHHASSSSSSDDALIAEITRKVMAQLNK